jgi:signal transduction histidine kinase
MAFKQPIGAVVVGRTQAGPAFTEPDKRLLTLFANLASPVVRNAQLFIQREEARSEAERANSVKTRFLASVTHELRTPLNLIINNLDFMRIGTFGEINPEQSSRLDQAIRSAEHLLSLINDLLDISKIEAGEMEITSLPSDLRPVLEDALDSAQMLIERKKAPVRLQQLIPSKLPLVPMDARRVRQVLTNLLSNAVKFTPQGTVTLAVQVYDDYVELAIKDTGMGIAAEEMDKLFQPFERTDRAKYMSIEGTGLGLPISRFLIEAHGGQLWIESQPGKGSIFTFTLPLNSDTRPISRPIKVPVGIE